MGKIGRPQGSKNKDDLNSLRKLLELGFCNNRIAIINRINAILEEGASLQDWKWLMQLKAQLEPKEVNANITGDGPKSVTIVHNYVPNSNGTTAGSGRHTDTLQPEANTSME